MKIKKIVSLLTAVMMLFSIGAISASAETDVTITVDVAASVKADREFDVAIDLEGSLAYIEMTVTYNTELFTYVDASYASDIDSFNLNDGKSEAGKLAIEYKPFTTTISDRTLASFKLQACNEEALDLAASDEGAIEIAIVEKAVGGGEFEDQLFNIGGDILTATLNNATVKVVKEHTAPSIETVVMTPATGVVGETITASTTGWSDNWGLTERTTYKWTVGGVTVSETDTYKPVEADLGKELTVTATPTVLEADGAEAPFTGEAKTATVKVVPADGYAPEAELELKKVTIGKEVELDYVLGKYANGVDASTYRWFVVEATDVETAIAAVEGAEALEGFTTANPTFEKTIGETEIKGMWAVVEVTAKEEIGGDVYPVDPTEPNVYYAAAEIKTAKSGGVQGGASLVTGTTETKPEVKPEEPGTVEPKPEEPGTEDPKPEEPKTEDPAGTANEAGAAAFTDVDKEAYAWAYDSIDTLAKSGVIKGMTADSFGPELSTTNAQVIALVVRIAGLAAEEGATTDKVDAEHWVYKEMAAAQAADILGVFGDEVDVEKATTREAAFTLLYNALKAAGVELKADAEDIAYSDAASIDENCKEAISALTKAGIINGMGDGTLAPKAEITRAQLAKILGLANAAK